MLWDEKIIEQLVEHPTMTSKVERENQMHTFGATSLRVWTLALVSLQEFGFGGQYLWYFRCETHNKFRDLLLKGVHQGLSNFMRFTSVVTVVWPTVSMAWEKTEASANSEAMGYLSVTPVLE